MTINYGGNSTLGIILQIASIVASFIIASIALFKDWILLTFFHPRLTIEEVNSTGQIGVTDANGQTPAVYYHLQIVNHRRKTLAIDCKVTLSSFQNLRHDGTWVETLIPVPPFFYWAPTESSDGRTDIFDFRRFDFLRVDNRNNVLSALPRVNRTFTETSWNVPAGGIIRYVLTIEGKNIPTSMQIWEVGWNGLWPYPETNNISIKKVL